MSIRTVFDPSFFDQSFPNKPPRSNEGSLLFTELTENKNVEKNGEFLTRTQRQQNTSLNNVGIEEHWRPENAGALVPRGNNEQASSMTERLLYAATHTDATQKRNLANLIAKERLYRKVFCDVSEDDPNLTDLSKCLENADMSFIKYKCSEKDLTLEALCKHIEQLVKLGYSLTYIFGYLSYLRRKYRGNYPKLRQQTSAFYRTLINLYETEKSEHKRLSTDEVYTCEERVYTQMTLICRNIFFSVEIEAQPSVEARKNQLIFAYVFLFMYETGKRLSEIALLGVEQLQTLYDFEALVIRIPKSKKLGRIVLRGFDENTRVNFRYFLERSIELFSKQSFSDCIPFDQYSKRRTLDRHFSRLYTAALRYLDLPKSSKPRGLSLHSLRRYRAASLFQQGKDIEHIRECLDHSSTKITNIYINKHLMRSYRKKNQQKDKDLTWKKGWSNSWSNQNQHFTKV